MRYQFGHCRLDTQSRELTRNGDPVHLSPKAYELLRVLIEARPRVVTKAELMAKLWPNTFVVEANLPVLVGEVRGALGDHANGGAIKTHHGVGYSFASEVHEAVVAGLSGEPGRTLVIRVGTRRLLLRQGTNLIGRDKDADIYLNDVSVSRAHARIVVEFGTAAVEDLESKNGTWLQGVPIHALTTITDGDELMFGTVRAHFLVERADEPTTQSF